MTDICEYCNNFEKKGKTEEKICKNCKNHKDSSEGCINFKLVFGLEFPGRIFRNVINNKNFAETFEFVISAILRGYSDQRIYTLFADVHNQTLIIKNLTTGAESKPIKIKSFSTDYEDKACFILGDGFANELSIVNLSSSSKKKPIIAFLEFKDSESIYNITKIKIPWFLKGKMQLDIIKINE